MWAGGSGDIILNCQIVSWGFATTGVAAVLVAGICHWREVPIAEVKAHL